MKRKILLIATVVFLNNAFAQQSRPAADTPTLKAYDFRCQGYEAAMDYVLQNRDSGMRVIVEVQARKSDTLIKVVGRALKELDREGYKNLILLASDADPKEKGMLESILIYINRSIYGLLGRGLSDNGHELWIYYNKDKKMQMQEYPDEFDIAAYLKMKVKQAYTKGKLTARPVVKNLEKENQELP